MPIYGPDSKNSDWNAKLMAVKQTSSEIIKLKVKKLCYLLSIMALRPSLAMRSKSYWTQIKARK